MLLKMDKETSDFDKWLQCFGLITDDLELVPALSAVSKFAGDALGLNIWFVEILGRRWSYIAGEIMDQPANSDIHRISLQDNIGVVSDTWEILSQTQRDKLIELLNKLVADRQASRCQGANG